MEADARKRGQAVQFIWAVELADIFNLGATWSDDKDGKFDARDRLNELAAASLLIIDDLGNNRIAKSDYFREQLQYLLDRITGRLVVTTNLILTTDGRGSLNMAVGEFVASRLHDRARIITLSGPDRRR
jgi:DNA replication protein DnaC